MERQRLRKARKRLQLHLAGTALLSAGLLVLGCATALDKARVAWSDGEGDLSLAEQHYRQALRDPNEEEIAREELLEIYNALGKERSKEQKFKAAEAYYRKAVELAPADEEALTGLAGTLRDLLRNEEALEIARGGMQSGDCTGCRRLTAVLLVQRADARMQNREWIAAEQDYSEAMAILPDASVALGVVRARYGNKEVESAAEGLRQAIGFVQAHDEDARRQFLELRRGVVLLALERDKVALADELLDLAPTGVGSEAQLGLALEIAMEFRKQGKPDLALARMDALLRAVNEGKLQLTEAQRRELGDRVASLYAARAGQRLSRGEMADAKRDMKEALELRPDDPELRLQGVLVEAGQGHVAEAHAQLEKIAANVDGRNEVAAILATLEVDQLLAAGKLEDARTRLDLAKTKAPELPEVHVAAAQFLARTPVPGMRAKDLQTLRNSGRVAYPNNRVTRVGEALSELDWARQQIRGLGPAYPYRAPRLEQRIGELEAQLRKFYPFAVRFQGEPTSVLVLRNKGAAAVTVEFDGGNIDSSAEVPAGGSARVAVAEPGLVQLLYGDTTAALVTEPYTELEIPL
jgi:tetratricopeptide (TPR) repeat protein